MKKNYSILAGALAISGTVFALDGLWLHFSDGLSLGLPYSNAESITLSDDKSQLIVKTLDEQTSQYNRADLTNITPADELGDAVTITFGDQTTVDNPLAFEGVSVEKSGDNVTVTSTLSQDLVINASGTTANGGIKVYGSCPVKIVLTDANITNGTGAAINVQSTAKTKIVVNGDSKLVDAKKYSTPSGESEKGTIYTAGSLNISGSGSLTVTGIKKHAIAAGDNLVIDSADVIIAEAVGDGANLDGNFTINGGSYTTTVSDDAIDASKITINDGTVTANVTLADIKGLKSSKDLTINGGVVNLNISGAQSKGIKSKGNTIINGGQVIATLTGDAVVVDNDPSYCTAIKSDKGVTIAGGEVKVVGTGKANKGISADGDIEISGGKIDINVSGDGETYTNTESAEDFYSATCIGADGNVTITGGTFTLTNSTKAGKCIKADLLTTIGANGVGPDMTFTLSGDAVVVAKDPSYCSAVKSKGDFVMNAGKITINGTGIANKGLSCDSEMTFNGGDINITLKGNGSTYTNTSNTADAYSSTCVTTDGNLNVLGGTFTLTNSGTAGKCMKADGNAIFGADGTAGPSITAKTSGAQIYVSSGSTGSTGGGWGGGRPGGGGGPGSGNDPDYSNPKVIKAMGDLTVNSGTFNLSSTSDGGEGLESKQTLTINGGTILVETVDDCINATSHVQFNGGQTQCISTGNDAVDSNGTLTIAGGTIIAMGTTTPECGLDCDNNRFTITGGTVVAWGGDTSTPTSSACTQPSFIYSSAKASTSTTITVTDSNGGHILSFKYPKTYSSSGKLVVTSPSLTKGNTYKIYTGGTVTGGTTFQTLTMNGTYTAGTQAKSFSLSSMVTTVR